jgi:hypothetical protein
MPSSEQHPTLNKAEPPIALHSRAEDNLRFIRSTMERAGTFTAVPGWGGVAMGVTAAATAALAHGRSEQQWLAIWLGEAAVAFVIAAVGVAHKARRAQVMVFGTAGRRFWLGFAAPAIACAALTVALYQAGLFALLPALWMLLYGAAVVAGGSNSTRVVPLMGAAFMVTGFAALWTPPSWNDVLLATSFGALHIAFGYRIARKHGG